MYLQTLTQLDFVQHPTDKLYPKHLADFNITIAKLSSRRGKQLSAAGKEENISSQMGFETKGRIKITLSPKSRRKKCHKGVSKQFGLPQ